MVIYNQKAPPTWAESNGELLRIFTAIYGYLARNSPKSSPKTRAPNVTERPKEPPKPPKEPGETYTIYTPYASFRELLWELEGLTMIYDEFLFFEKVCSEV